MCESHHLKSSLICLLQLTYSSSLSFQLLPLSSLPHRLSPIPKSQLFSQEAYYNIITRDRLRSLVGFCNASLSSSSSNVIAFSSCRCTEFSNQFECQMYTFWISILIVFFHLEHVTARKLFKLLSLQDSLLNDLRMYIIVNFPHSNVGFVLNWIFC